MLNCFHYDRGYAVESWVSRKFNAKMGASVKEITVILLPQNRKPNLTKLYIPLYVFAQDCKAVGQ